MRNPWGVYRVVGRSMSPTLDPGDLLLASHRRDPSPGSVVVLTGPDGTVLVKRVVAGGGSEVVLSGGVLTVDGAAWPSVLDIPGQGTWTISEGRWFVLSDAPDRTTADSRTFGPVRVDVVRGVVLARVWPGPALIADR